MNFPVALRVIVSVLICANVETETLNPNCELMVRCSFNEDIVWATDGKQCYPFVNPCHYRNDICYRLEMNLQMLRRVNRKNCQPLCVRACTKIFAPVCGMYNGVTKEFANQCMMDVHICTTAEFYQLYKNEPC